MKTSELITALTASLEAEGDLEIVCRIPHCCKDHKADEKSWYAGAKPEVLNLSKLEQKNPWDPSHKSYLRKTRADEKMIAIVSPADFYKVE